MMFKIVYILIRVLKLELSDLFSVCQPELHMKFDTLAADIARNPGIGMQNVRYMGDGTAFFDGNAAINDNTFANTEWGRDVYVYIR